MELIRGRWSKKYINCWEDKRDYDIMRRAFAVSHEDKATKYCERFSVPELTTQEKKEISDYWAQFGIKIYNYDFHRMYYHTSGIKDPRFVPDMIVGLIVYEYYNDRRYEFTWRDKNMFSRLLPDVPLPKEYARRIKGRYVTADWKYFDSEQRESFAEEVWNSLGGEKDVVIKISRDAGRGRNVKKHHFSSKEDILNTLKEWENFSDFVIQECIAQHKVMASFNETSSNVMRVCSWRHGNEVDIMFAAVRAGVGDSFTDVSQVDGEERVSLIGISHKDGYFEDKIIDQNGNVVKTLPEKVKIPAWDKIVEIIKQNHLLADNLGVIGWDFTIDQNENPVCFEWNIAWPGSVYYQYANQRPLYGDKTEEILAFLKDEKNRANYIPYYMQLK